VACAPPHARRFSLCCKIGCYSKSGWPHTLQAELLENLTRGSTHTFACSPLEGVDIAGREERTARGGGGCPLAPQAA
jgi:hypothetical protein